MYIVIAVLLILLLGSLALNLWLAGLLRESQEWQDWADPFWEDFTWEDEETPSAACGDTSLTEGGRENER